jgi:hypothetical protein
LVERNLAKVEVASSRLVSRSKLLIAFRKRRCHGDQKGSGRFAYVSEVIMLFKQVADAFAASWRWDSASLSRLAFWVGMLGEREFTAVTADDVDDALVTLAERGRLHAGRRPTQRTGQPLFNKGRIGA